MKTTAVCLECNQPLSPGVNEFSQRLYGYSLCMKDQYLMEESGATAQAIDLYLALKSRDFPVVLAYDDGFKPIDMALPGKLYIEVTGFYDHTSSHAMADLSWSVFSPGKKIPTIIIPISLLSNPKSFSHTVNELSKACRLMLNKTSMLSLVPAIKAVQLQ